MLPLELTRYRTRSMLGGRAARLPQRAKLARGRKAWARFGRITGWLGKELAVRLG
jgi:hypothetical protein